MKDRRPNLAKEYFLEGVRQKWAAIFTAIGILILVGTSYGLVHDPDPFLQFFLSIGVTFILGASVTDVMKTLNIGKAKELEDEKDDIKINEELIIKGIEEKHVDDPSYRPINPTEYNDEPFR